MKEGRGIDTMAPIRDTRSGRITIPYRLNARARYWGMVQRTGWLAALLASLATLIWAARLELNDATTASTLGLAAVAALALSLWMFAMAVLRLPPSEGRITLSEDDCRGITWRQERRGSWTVKAGGVRLRGLESIEPFRMAREAAHERSEAVLQQLRNPDGDDQAVVNRRAA
ncbi:hypothetical protein ACN2MM_08505 [Alkalilimnicola ehrlichii MLHE-1]|uniref:Uncharacterized protein n=1 Tax=Alkalilimnicola ehrlichii (strain ATCC BAA-1101 / DSM 17681 / MLHE-1) TaxID=187272 RepID=Q0A8D4_ALKEH|nr:hypothetical protein [Alkalilimnicola ehrlichii]ABI56903.1 hypothetical protein Mlg_1556 [Alkalilimnicola ehrlichii MLHE-1]